MADRRTIILEAATRMIAQAGVRGLRVERIAETAEVSTALIYYHFTDRAGLLRETLAFIADRADRYTRPDPESADARTVLEQVLLLELQDSEAVRENSTAWGELRSTAIFETYLRDQLRDSTRQWITDITELADKALAEQASGGDPAAIAERLTALVEGLSERWLSGSIELSRAQHMLRESIRIELTAACGLPAREPPPVLIAGVCATIGERVPPVPTRGELCHTRPHRQGQVAAAGPVEGGRYWLSRMRSSWWMRRQPYSPTGCGAARSPATPRCTCCPQPTPDQGSRCRY